MVVLAILPFLPQFLEMLLGLLLLEEAKLLRGCERNLEVLARQSAGEA